MVLINEFGTVGLDHQLVGQIDGEPLLLGGGCICCTLRSDVRDSLLDLWARRGRGEVPAFERVVIETTGLADPTPIMASIAGDLALRHHFRPGQVITTFDTLNGPVTLLRYPESLQQVRMADVLLVTKRDLADPGELRNGVVHLRTINPLARIEPIEAGAAPLATLLGLDLGDEMDRSVRWVGTATESGSRHGGVAATVIESDVPLNWAAFGLWFSLLAHRHGSQVLRMKGILTLQDSETPVVVQSAQHLVHRPQHLSSKASVSGRSFLVLITDGLDPVLLSRSFDVMVRRTIGDTDLMCRAKA